MLQCCLFRFIIRDLQWIRQEFIICSSFILICIGRFSLTVRFTVATGVINYSSGLSALANLRLHFISKFIMKKMYSFIHFYTTFD